MVTRLYALLIVVSFAILLPPSLIAQGQQPDWSKVEAETMQHFQALLRLDTRDPPGREALRRST